MKCPKCNQDMVEVRRDTTSNLSNEEYEEYFKTVFQCQTDDIWVAVEVPKPKNVQINLLK